MARVTVDPMLVVIARESLAGRVPLGEYAQRAAAYNATLARPYGERTLAEVYVSAVREFRGAPGRGLRKEVIEVLRIAASDVVRKRKQVWNTLSRNINTEGNDDE